MYKKFVAISLAGLVFFIACKKSDNPTPKPNTTDSTTVVPDSVAILGNWRPIHDATSYFTLSGQKTSSDSIILQPDDYYNFKNGKMYYFDHDFGYSNYDTVPYVVSNHYLITYGNTGVADSLHLKISHDTASLTQIWLNDSDPLAPTNEYDTLIMVKTK